MSACRVIDKIETSKIIYINPVIQLEPLVLECVEYGSEYICGYLYNIHSNAHCETLSPRVFLSHFHAILLLAEIVYVAAMYITCIAHAGKVKTTTPMKTKKIKH